MLLMEANDDTDAARAAAGRAAEAGKPTRPLVAMLIGKIYVYPGDGADVQWKISAFVVSA